MADQGEGPRGLRHPPYFGERKKKESQKEEKPAGQATNTPPPPSLAQGLDLPLNAVALLHFQ